ncbi:hypothetical protein EOPP23_21255 [Endozoicomonas sp. OPT23]|uniref:hypothetical protein n=1 Tax=Endozoicomonas sp. OPT23 TaxID=2072845 RepID=UPI00129A65FD|nr:hypothetical protein [Endozoicomonas sp. OPT23]MRI35491.1 hypothetical protein [Endozoicomonas sp. OPT23]
MKLTNTLTALSLIYISQFSAAETPDAYLHTLATGTENQQLVLRLPMSLNKEGRLIGHLNSNKSPALSSEWEENWKYGWEVVGRYNALCPHYDYGNSGSDKTGNPTDDIRAKSQSMVVLEDNSLVFTCERTNILILHPNQGVMSGSYQQQSESDSDFLYPETNIDISSLLTSDKMFDAEYRNRYPNLAFDQGYKGSNYNLEYGISLSYDQKNELVYVGFEDQVFYIDLAVYRELNSQDRVKTERFLKPLINTHDNKPVKVEESTSIIALSHIRYRNYPTYLFTSSATPDHRDAPAPQSMINLSEDGRSAVFVEKSPWAEALQYARLEFENGRPVDDSGDGLKADITYIASDSAPNAEPVLTAHIHHNAPIAIFDPQLTTPGIVAQLNRHRATDTLGPQTSNPEIYNEITTGSARKLIEPFSSDFADARITRMFNYKIPREDIQPNYYSLDDRIIKRLNKKKPPKQWHNNDVFVVYGGFHYAMPWKDDVTFKLFSQPIISENGWKEGNQPKADWQESAELPDIYFNQHTYDAEGKVIPTFSDDNQLSETQYHKHLTPKLLPRGSTYWDAFYISPAY